jgi:hypothetical protein
MQFSLGIWVFLAGLSFELRAPALATQVLYHLSHTCSPFCFSYFTNWISNLCLGSLDCYPPIYPSNIAGMIVCVTTPSSLLVEMGSHELFAHVGLEP